MGRNNEDFHGGRYRDEVYEASFKPVKPVAQENQERENKENAAYDAAERAHENGYDY
jgi:hypothetical protein